MGASRLIGTVGAWIALWFAMLALTLWITNVSMKQTIGRVIVFFGGLKPPPMPKLPKLQMELPGHESLREAFALPMKPIQPRSVVQAELEISPRTAGRLAARRRERYRRTDDSRDGNRV